MDKLLVKSAFVMLCLTQNLQISPFKPFCQSQLSLPLSSYTSIPNLCIFSRRSFRHPSFFRIVVLVPVKSSHSLASYPSISLRPMPFLPSNRDPIFDIFNAHISLSLPSFPTNYYHVKPPSHLIPSPFIPVHHHALSHGLRGEIRRLTFH